MTLPGKTKVYLDKDFQDIVPDFIEAYKKNIQEIKDALKSNNFQSLRTIGHNLKGTGGGYGFEEISQHGHKLNEAAKKEDVKAIKDLLPTMESYFSRIEIVYKTFDY